MTRLVDALLAFVARLCLNRYTLALTQPGLVAALPVWADRVAQKWALCGLAGPADAPEWDVPASRTAATYAWMLGYDQSLDQETQGCQPDPLTATLWAAISIEQPWYQRLGAETMRLFTYGTTCRCCLGYRVILLTLTALGVGYTLG
jgi:hypothetical protein